MKKQTNSVIYRESDTSMGARAVRYFVGVLLSIVFCVTCRACSLYSIHKIHNQYKIYITYNIYSTLFFVFCCYLLELKWHKLKNGIKRKPKPAQINVAQKMAKKWNCPKKKWQTWKMGIYYVALFFTVVLQLKCPIVCNLMFFDFWELCLSGQNIYIYN